MRVLTGVRYPAGRLSPARSTARGSTLNSRSPGSSRPTSDTSRTRAAETGDVVRGIAGAAGHDLGRVVFEDQHRRLARHAGDAAVDELVGDQIAEDDDALAAAGRDQARQSSVSVESSDQCHQCNP